MAGKRDQKPRLPAADLTGSVIAALKAELLGEAPPEGWYSVRQISDILSVSFEAAMRLAKRKKWPRKSYMTTTVDGRKLTAHHFYIL
jgi:hypothetical protein